MAPTRAIVAGPWPSGHARPWLERGTSFHITNIVRYTGHDAWQVLRICVSRSRSHPSFAPSNRMPAAMSNLNTATVHSVHHWTDTMFSLPTTRAPGFPFATLQLTMIGPGGPG